MYYVALFFAIVTAVLAARLCVCLATRIARRWLRRVVFWIVMLPIALVLCGAAVSSVSDDMDFLTSPSHFCGVWVPIIVFLLAFIGQGLFGFGTGWETGVLRAHNWSAGGTGRRLLVALTLLASSVVLFDLELQYQLRNLKAETLAGWKSAGRSKVADHDNAAIDYMKLQQWGATLEAWAEETGDAEIDDTHPTDSLFDGLDECDPAFDVLRQGSRKPQCVFSRDNDNPIPVTNDQRISFVWKTVRLFRWNLLRRAHLGEVSEAWDDVSVMRRVATHLDSEVGWSERGCASAARFMAMQCVERLLQLDPQPDDALLRSLINDPHNPRQNLPALFAQEEADYVTRMCNTYLGLLSKEQEKELGRPPTDGLPPVMKYLVHVPDRLAHARDDLTALRRRSSVARTFADRWDDPTATSDAFVDELINSSIRIGPGPFPSGATAPADERDLLFHSASSARNSQRMIHTMAAVTLFHREHGRYPEGVGELVPEYLSSVPVCVRRCGRPFRIRPLGDGAVIYGLFGADSIERDL